VLTLDPAARALQADAGWMALTAAWLDTGRADGLSATARTWACRFMLKDLAARHTPAELAHVREAMRGLAALDTR
jgi:hypothetical protein